MITVSKFTISGRRFDDPLKLIDIGTTLDKIGSGVYIVPAISFWQMFYSMERKQLEIVLYNLSKRDEYICLECVDESQYGIEEHNLFLSILKPLVKDPKKFYILTGGIGPDIDRVIRHDVFEKRTAELYCSEEKDFDLIKSMMTNRDHTAICLNKRTAIHRLSIVEYLLSVDNGRNYISCPSGYWDWLPVYGEVNGSLSLREINGKLDLNRSRRFYNGIGDESFYDKLPLVVDVINHTNGRNPIPSVECNRVIFDYITETQFDREITFITEKSYKSFAQLTIPIFIGTPGIVRELRNKGYKLNALDYSYDNILDHKKRFTAIMKLIKVTQDLSQEELIELYHNNLHDITHNYNLLLRKK